MEVEQPQPNQPLQPKHPEEKKRTLNPNSSFIPYISAGCIDGPSIAAKAAAGASLESQVTAPPQLDR
ncbi:hypothetical protein ABZP36_031715, partial [Zizania latifolia]